MNTPSFGSIADDGLPAETGLTIKFVPEWAYHLLTILVPRSFPRAALVRFLGPT